MERDQDKVGMLCPHLQPSLDGKPGGRIHATLWRRVVAAEAATSSMVMALGLPLCPVMPSLRL